MGYLGVSIAFNAGHNTNICLPIYYQTVHIDKIIIIHVAVLPYTITIVRIQPHDPCPAYSVTRYVFNISDDNGNFIDTISHMGNTSITINGSDYDLIRDQVYRLTVEAINDAGSTPSEEILLCKSNVLLS